MSQLQPGDWADFRDPCPQHAPCMLVYEITEKAARVRWIWPDSEGVAPVTLKATRDMAAAAGWSPYLGRYPVADLVKIEGRRDKR